MIPALLLNEDLSPRPLSRLSYKIMGLNLIAVILLIAGIVYLDQYRQNLTEAETEIMATEARLYTSLLADNAVRDDAVVKPAAEKFLVSFISQKPQRLRLFDGNQKLVIDVQGATEKPFKSPGLPGWFGTFLDEGFATVVDLFLPTFKLPSYPSAKSGDITSFPDVQDAFNGKVSFSAWRNEKGGLILSSAAPITKNDKISGVLLVTRTDTQIEKTFAAMRLDILKFFLGALVITLSFSLYLSAVIGHPLRQLANSAGKIQAGRGGIDVIPDLSGRQDEIGELSVSLRDMTSALQNRMQSIEHFAADVAHELKNPLTSIRSAIETLDRVKDDKDRARLMSIITHDLARMDRLISDISQSSRLDAELARDVLQPVNLSEILKSVIESYRSYNSIEQANKIATEGLDKSYFVSGNPSRLSQVFQNLLSNALSFSPQDQIVSVTIHKDGKNHIRIDIDDNGPGIPEKAEDKIFERFYTERPQSESFGNHSGLGLSIVRQIVDAHNGTVTATNRHDENENIIGARFSVELETI